MSEPLPPVLNPPPLQNAPQKQSFARQAATFSVFAPLAAVGISILLQPQVRGNRIAMIVLGLTSVSLIVLGCILGVTALVVAKRRGEKGVFGTAMAGTIISGLLTLLMLLSIPGLMKALDRAKQGQKQQSDERR